MTETVMLLFRVLARGREVIDGAGGAVESVDFYGCICCKLCPIN